MNSLKRREQRQKGTKQKEIEAKGENGRLLYHCSTEY
jgi:hypothetical protein